MYFVIKFQNRSSHRSEILRTCYFISKLQENIIHKYILHHIPLKLLQHSIFFKQDIFYDLSRTKKLLVLQGREIIFWKTHLEVVKYFENVQNNLNFKL